MRLVEHAAPDGACWTLAAACYRHGAPNGACAPCLRTFHSIVNSAEPKKRVKSFVETGCDFVIITVPNPVMIHAVR